MTILFATNISRSTAQRTIVNFCCAGLLVSLSACQTLHPPALPKYPTNQSVTDNALNSSSETKAAPIHFSITGKIGVHTPKQSGSAFYAWTQDDQRFAIDLTGALGIGQTHIEGIPGKVTLQSAKTGNIEATTPEELLQRATGWQAPISYLPHWIEGQPVTEGSTATRDAQNRLSTLDEGGWNVIFNYADQSSQPSRLVMTSQLTDTTDNSSQSNRVILTIQHEGDSAASGTP